MSAQVQAPDERIFRAHVAGATFQMGVEAGRWRLVSTAWPNALVAISAAARSSGPEEFYLRFELTNYPADAPTAPPVEAPTATPWDPASCVILPVDRRPMGQRVGLAFRTNWEDGRALYIPCDRIAIPGHEGWATQARAWAWDSSKDITVYLRLVHQMLNDEDYEGV